MYQKTQLAYCSNVHPGVNLESVELNLGKHFSAVRKLRKLPAMASGLWLSAKSAGQLANSAKDLLRFKESLAINGAQLTSLNGFPFGDFHLSVVKEKVYLPTWAESSRLRYTQQLAQILADCLPSNETTGAISTLPFAYASQWSETLQRQAIEQLLVLVQFLETLEAESGKRIVICIEMEPDCVFQSTDALVSFFKNELLPAAEKHNIAATQILRYIGCCYDTCHQAVMGEDINQSLQAIHALGIYIGKVQISNAIQAKLSSPQHIASLTERFDDERFLHQTKIRHQGKLVAELKDLNINQLEQLQNHYGELQARIHYHIPIHQSSFPESFLGSTQSAITTTLDFISGHLTYLPKLEIETYTWLNLLQQDEQQTFNLHNGLLAEFRWLEQALIKRNLIT